MLQCDLKIFETPYGYYSVFFICFKSRIERHRLKIHLLPLIRIQTLVLGEDAMSGKKTKLATSTR